MKSEDFQGALPTDLVYLLFRVGIRAIVCSQDGTQLVHSEQELQDDALHDPDRFTHRTIQPPIFKEHLMDRREFINKGISAGIVSGTALFLGRPTSLFGRSSSNPSKAYDLVAVKGGEPDAMFDRAIESYGGMKQFVAKGQTVVVKPNIGWDVIPENGANTNPKLVKRVIEHCFNAGAKDVYVFDHTCDNWVRSYKNSGIEQAARDAGAKVVSGETEGYYQDVTTPGGKNVQRAKIHELMLSSNVVINVPVLKVHGGAEVTASMKNLMGVVWDRRFWHRNDLHQCIADFSTYCKPALNVVDAYTVMTSNGPRGTSRNDVVEMKSLILSRDIVSADAASVKLLGFEPDAIRHIAIADAMKVGRKDLSSLSINRIRM
jgi:uncharacterized protein (DUF362 family)